MVQGLGFLSKKSWHTKNLANQEKVWMAEQRKEAEAAKTKELAKQIQQEREQEEMDKISGKKNRLDRGIEWMYQEGTRGDLARQDAEKKAEEFLLGKEYVGEGAVKGDFDAGNKLEGINSALQTTQTAPPDAKPPPVAAAASAATATAPSYYEPSVQERNESFRIRLEDPMFQVNQRQRELEEKAEKKRELFEKVVGPVVPKPPNDEVRPKDEAKKAKKNRKHEKKSRKKRSRHHNDDSSVESYEDRHRDRKRSRRKRSRSRSRERSSRRHRRRSRSRSESDGSSSDRYHSGRRDSKRDRHNYQHDRRHDRRDHDEYRRESSRFRGADSREVDGRRHANHGSPRGHRERTNTSAAMEIPPKPRQSDGYGLQGADGFKRKGNDLGPDSRLLKKHRDEKEAERQRLKAAAARKRRTPEERERALRAMQEDAMARDTNMSKQAKPNNEKEDYGSQAGKSAAFLNDMTKKVHGLEGSNSLAQRVAQNRHTNQQLHESFM